jgi:catalase
MTALAAIPSSWVNAKGEASWVKYHFKTDQELKCLTSEEAIRIAGQDPDCHGRDLFSAINHADYASLTLKMQIMPVAEAAKIPIQPI